MTLSSFNACIRSGWTGVHLGWAGVELVGHERLIGDGPRVMPGWMLYASVERAVGYVETFGTEPRSAR